MNRLPAYLRGDDARRLVGCLIGALVVAVMTGQAGSNAAPTSGLRQSLLDVRVVWFLLLGLAVWLIGMVVTHRARDVAGAKAATGSAWRSVTGHRPVRYTWYVVLIAVLIAAPPLLTTPYQQLLVDSIGIYVLLALGLNVVIGFAGLLDLGFIAFFAVGAYATAYFTGSLPVKPPFELTPFLCFPIAIALATGAGVLLGAPTLRLRGDYLAIVTLGFGEIVFDVAVFSHFTGGGQGVAKPVPHFVFGSYHWTLQQMPYWYLLLGILVVVVTLLTRLEHSRVGRAWTAIREDEVAAEASGIPALRYKVLAFAIGASTSGFAGTFYASKIGFFDPGQFTVQISILVLVLVIFGGMGSIWGTIVGAAILQFIPGYIRISGSKILPAQDIFIYVGFILVIMMIFRPQGLIPSRRRSRELGLVEEDAEPAVGALAAPGSAP